MTIEEAYELAHEGWSSLNIRIQLKEHGKLPTYGTRGAAGMDLYADCSETNRGMILIPAGSRALIKCGFSIAIPSGFEGQVRPRSGLALKAGITVLNAPGTIDSDYRGEVGVILYNTEPTSFTVNHHDRIAQMVIAPVMKAVLIESISLESTARGEGGYGSTGTR